MPQAEGSNFDLGITDSGKWVPTVNDDNLTFSNIPDFDFSFFLLVKKTTYTGLKIMGNLVPINPDDDTLVFIYQKSGDLKYKSDYNPNAGGGGGSQWTDITGGIQYANKVAVGGNLDNDSAAILQLIGYLLATFSGHTNQIFADFINDYGSILQLNTPDGSTARIQTPHGNLDFGNSGLHTNADFVFDGNPVLKSPDGSAHRVIVANDGTLSTTPY